MNKLLDGIDPREGRKGSMQVAVIVAPVPTDPAYRAQIDEAKARGFKVMIRDGYAEVLTK